MQDHQGFSSSNYPNVAFFLFLRLSVRRSEPALTDFVAVDLLLLPVQEIETRYLRFLLPDRQLVHSVVPGRAIETFHRDFRSAALPLHRLAVADPRKIATDRSVAVRRCRYSHHSDPAGRPEAAGYPRSDPAGPDFVAGFRIRLAEGCEFSPFFRISLTRIIV